MSKCKTSRRSTQSPPSTAPSQRAILGVAWLALSRSCQARTLRLRPKTDGMQKKFDRQASVVLMTRDKHILTC
jgi:hypothetical protein